MSKSKTHEEVEAEVNDPLPLPFFPVVDFKQSYFWVAYAMLAIVVSVVSFAAPQFIRAGNVQTTVTKTVKTGQNIGTMVGEVEVGDGQFCNMWSKKTTPVEGDKVFLECVLPPEPAP